MNCPVLKRAEDYKNTLIEAENIKYKLEAKDEEIKELKKSLKLKVKTKNNNLYLKKQKF